MTTKVLVVGDQALVRGGLRAMLDLQPDFTVVGEAPNLSEALSRAQRLEPDVLVVDAPNLAGHAMEAARQFPGLQALTRTLLLTNDRGSHEILHAHAWGLLFKNADAPLLAAAVRILAAGYRLQPMAPQQGSGEGLLVAREGGDHAATIGDVGDERMSTLTPRELEVLRLVVRGLSNGEIAAELTVSESTVKSHVQGLLTKLGLRDRVQAVIYAYETGFVRPATSARPTGLGAPAAASTVQPPA
jgi:DNA-binding NarL/FixJ family response regulator